MRKDKKEIEKEIDLKGYFINESKSYGINKSGGYVMLLNFQYSNASVFSPVLDKYNLFINIISKYHLDEKLIYQLVDCI